MDQKLDRIVALKFLPLSYSSDDEIKKRFIQEAKAVSKLQHNNICTIHEINETEEGQLFICMDYYKGKSLKEKLENGKLELNEALDITIQICEGLKNAHEKNIIHRDIKPANIFITNDGIVKILDFGLAKIKGESQLTKTGSTVGTTAYMSPEQAKGENVDQRTDIWSLGVVFYQMISGMLPFKGEYDQAIIYSILNKSPEELNTAKKIKKFIYKCLQKKTVNRYQSIDEILVEFNLISPDSLKRNIFINEGRPFKKIISNQFIRRFGFIIFLLLAVALSWPLIRNFFSSTNIQEQKQVAVLPFLNVGNDPSGQAFCDGLIETLTSQLTQMPQFNSAIQVIPSSEIRERKVVSAKEASQIFGADLAVTGSIQKNYNKIRLILNLVDAKSLRQISSSIDDYSLTNVYKFQDLVFNQLAGMLEVKLKPEEIDHINDGVTAHTDAYVFYTQGEGYLQKYWDTRNINDAIRLFHEALNVDSQYVYAFAGLGKAYLRKYRNEKDTKWIDSALIFSKYAEIINRNLTAVHLTSGLILNEKGNYNGAAKEFKKVIEQDKYNSEAYNGLAKSYLSLNLNDEAESTYKQAIRLKPSYWVGYNDLGVFYYINGKYKSALEQFKKVVELTPDNIFGLNNLGSIYMYLERWPEAESIFKHLIDIKQDYSAYSNLGSIYFFHDENFKVAANMFIKALELDSSNYVIWGNVASAYFQIPGYKDKSYKYFNRAVDLGEKELLVNPNDPGTMSNLASYYSMLNDKEKSIKYLEKSLKLSPNDLEIMARGVVTFESLGERDKAVKLAEIILEKGYPISNLEKSPDLNNMLKDKRFEKLKERFSNTNK